MPLSKPTSAQLTYNTQGEEMQPTNQTPGHKMLSPTRRWSSLLSFALLLLLLIFFVLHQKDRTGFFSSNFGIAEMLALYLPIVIAMLAPFLRIMLGTIEPARLVEAISDIFLGIGSIYLRLTFPFDFSHFGDIFAPNLRFAFSWLTDNVGRFILLLQIIFAVISILAALGTYLTEAGKLPLRPIQPGSKDTKNPKS